MQGSEKGCEKAAESRDVSWRDFLEFDFWFGSPGGLSDLDAPTGLDAYPLATCSDFSDCAFGNFGRIVEVPDSSQHNLCR